MSRMLMSLPMSAGGVWIESRDSPRVVLQRLTLGGAVYEGPSDALPHKRTPSGFPRPQWAGGQTVEAGVGQPKRTRASRISSKSMVSKSSVVTITPSFC